MRLLSKLLLISLFLNNVAHSLEIDEKLTLRFLKVSNSKKTILINRGAEDGLAVGDHAKFFITTGVIARGVVEKVSPSRSIWSLYRVVDPAEMTDGKVLNLKIASPVKVTTDPSKSMKEEEIPGGTDKMSMSEDGQSDKNEKLENIDKDLSESGSLNDTDKKELEGLGLDDSEKPTKKETTKKEKSKKNEINDSKEVSMEELPPMKSSSTRLWESWGTLYINSLSGTVSSDASTTTTTNSTATTSSTIDFSAGIERYFFNNEGMFKNVSLVGFVHKRSEESGQDIKLTSDWFEYGAGINYHFYNSPASFNRLIGYGSLDAGVGNATLKSTVVSNSVATESSVKGTSQFFSLGVGAKYILSNGFGLRAILDYYSASESFDYGDAGKTKRSLAGPRIQFGLSYRF